VASPINFSSPNNEYGYSNQPCLPYSPLASYEEHIHRIHFYRQKLYELSYYPDSPNKHQMLFIHTRALQALMGSVPPLPNFYAYHQFQRLGVQVPNSGYDEEEAQQANLSLQHHFQRLDLHPASGTLNPAQNIDEQERASSHFYPSFQEQAVLQEQEESIEQPVDLSQESSNRPSEEALIPQHFCPSLEEQEESIEQPVDLSQEPSNKAPEEATKLANASQVSRILDEVLAQQATQKRENANKIALVEAAAKSESAASQVISAAASSALVIPSLNTKFVSIAQDHIKQRPIIDLIGLAKDYKLLCNRVAPKKMAKEHAAKRINLFLFACEYISSNKSQLQGYEFSSRMPLHAFSATSYSVPRTTFYEKINNRSDDLDPYQNTHIALLNKLVLEKNKNYYKVQAQTQYFNVDKMVSLQDLLNVCDTAPKSLNDLDGYVEDHVRPSAVQCLDWVKSNNMRPVNATQRMTVIFAQCLIDLVNFKKGGTLPPLPGNNSIEFTKRYTDRVTVILKSPHTSDYIEGMQEAIAQFAALHAPKTA
jgi:hypothetical protein